MEDEDDPKNGLICYDKSYIGLGGPGVKHDGIQLPRREAIHIYTLLERG
jgi:hypothetical protein